MEEKVLSEAALQYAANGWRIMPLHSPTANGCSCRDQECAAIGKHPRVKFTEATADVSKVRDWWTRWPDANIGLTLPDALALDIDPRSSGSETLARIEAEYGELNARSRQRTGSGGWHYLFASVQGAKPRSGVERGIDIKTGQNAYIVAAPSVHQSGGRYAWIDGPHPLSHKASEIALWVAPEWVQRLAIGAQQVQAADSSSDAPRAPQESVEEHISRAVAKLAEGMNRNDAGFYLFCQMRDDSYNKTACKGVVSEWVRRANLAHPGSHRYVAAEANASLSSVFTKPPRAPKDEKRPRREQETDELEKLLAGVVQFFNDSKDPFARISVGNHHECWPISSDRFRQIILARYYDAHGTLPGKDALQEFLNLCAFRGMQGSINEVFCRIGHRTEANGERAIYLDLCDEEWRAVEITSNGWRIIAEPRVHFRRAQGMLPLPLPEEGGSLDLLRPLINAGKDEIWILVCAWLAGVFQPVGAQAILLLQGSQGSAKSTAATLLRKLIDPSAVMLSGPPRSERDCAITCVNSGIVAFDNLSGVQPWLSDAMCRIASGAGFRTRTMTKDTDEQILRIRRPMLLNGIDNISERNDLIDRCIGLNLERITDKTRRTEQGIYEAFDQAHQRILGALLSAVSAGLRNLPNVKLTAAPRMVDFAHFVVSCEEALPCKRGEFLEVYNANRFEASESAIDDDSFASAVAGFAKAYRDGGYWCGTAQMLLDVLSDGNSFRSADRWPRDAAAVGKWLRRAEPGLRVLGVIVERRREGKQGTRKLAIRYEPPAPQTADDGQQASIPVLDLDEAA